jgi:hypothetical protein
MNVKTVYLSDDESYRTELVAFANTDNRIFIQIYLPEGDSVYDSQHIVLDKRTAIRLVKDLKREISILDKEVGDE